MPAEHRYQVRLPRSPHSAALGESLGQARQRFLSNERSMLRKGTWESFQGVVQEYVDLGHASKVSEEELRATPPQEVYYMPMHAVFKKSSSTTKVRVVYDASARTSSGNSLNDMLEVGPTINPTLQDAY